MFTFWKKKKDERKKGSVATFSLDGMHCVSCGLTIDGNLEELPGVLSATTSYARGTTTVEYDPETTNIKALITCIEVRGYKATELQNDL